MAPDPMLSLSDGHSQSRKGQKESSRWEGRKKVLARKSSRVLVPSGSCPFPSLAPGCQLVLCAPVPSALPTWFF